MFSLQFLPGEVLELIPVSLVLVITWYYVVQ